MPAGRVGTKKVGSTLPESCPLGRVISGLLLGPNRT